MENLPKVAIVGLLPGQAECIRSDYADKLDLSFVESKATTATIQSTANGADHVLLWTKYNSHRATKALHGHAGLDFFHGGMSSLKLKLDDILKS